MKHRHYQNNLLWHLLNIRYRYPLQNINGNYKVQDVSGDTININDNYNEIKIHNVDVSLIRANGNYNTVYYITCP